MGRLKVRSKHVRRRHRTIHRDLAISRGSTGSNAAIVAAQAEAAVRAADGLRADVLLGGARVGVVNLLRKRLVPEGRSSADSGVRSVAVQAKIGTRSRDGRLAAWSQIVNSDDVATNLGRQIYRGEQDQQTRESEMESHYIPSLARLGNPK